MIGDRRDLLLHQDLGELGVDAGEVEVGVDDLARLDALVLDLDRLLHLHDHLGALPDLVRSGDDLRADALVLAVGDAGALTGALLDHHLVTLAGQRGDSGRNHSDAVLAGLDLLRHSDDHDGPPGLRRAWAALVESGGAIQQRQRGIKASTVTHRDVKALATS
jgi:hypothetical protein